MSELEAELHRLLVPRDPNDERNVILEVRAGTGGDEAALFAADLYRMYARYADTRRWKLELLSVIGERGGRLQGGDRRDHRRAAPTRG